MHLHGAASSSLIRKSATSRSFRSFVPPISHCIDSALLRSSPLPLHTSRSPRQAKSSLENPCSRVLQRASQQVARAGNGSSRDFLEDYVEVKVDRLVTTPSGSAVILLRSADRNQYIEVFIGPTDTSALRKEIDRQKPIRREVENSALVKEINKQKYIRPLTHDLAKSMLSAMGCRVTKVRINEIVSNTYYSRVHISGPPKPTNNNPLTGGAANGFAAAFNAAAAAASGAAGGAGTPFTSDGEVEVDARPSDAINMALRFGAKIYVKRSIMDECAKPYQEVYPTTAVTNESQAEIVRSVRDVLASYDDPTIMHILKKDLAIQEERFEDASKIQQELYHEMTHNSTLRMMIAMEAALADHRYEEAARLRDEFKRELLNPSVNPSVI